MPAYQISKLCLHTELSFPELNATSDKNLSPLHLTCSDELASKLVGLTSYHTWQQFNFNVWLNLYQHEDAFFIEYPEHCIFKVESSRQQISYQRLGIFDDSLFRHLLLDQVIPLFLSLNFRLVLHAAAVGTPQSGATIIVAQSGGGKSTLTAELSSYLPVLSDDFVLCMFEPLAYAYPSYPALRISEPNTCTQGLEQISDEGKIRYRLPPASYQSTACKVKNLILLNREERKTAGEFTLAPAPTELSIARLLQNIFVLETNSNQKQTSILEQLGWLLDTCPCYQLSFSDLHGHGKKLYEALSTL
jgi:hypothetical protein